ncbi:MAG TPA: YdcF family protein [Lacibacter sp.]|nr:YdcF family protein [Lacibacter sp.]HMO87728.1 YdcF family protein [Lacibacter sp.]
MFFLLSKILLFFIQPFNWLLLSALTALLTRHPVRRKRLWIFTAVLFLVFSNPALIEAITLRWQAKERILQPGEQYEAGILLTGFCAFEEKTGKGYFKGANDRFIQTVRLYHQGHIKKIIVSGGNSSIRKSRQTWKEADFIVEQLLQMGIPAADVYKDNRSRNTHENGLFSKAIIDSLQLPPPYLLITSATHIKRSQYVFRKIGLTATDYPTHFTVIGNPLRFPGSFLPAYKAFDLWDTFMKENVGLLMYRLTGKA